MRRRSPHPASTIVNRRSPAPESAADRDEASLQMQLAAMRMRRQAKRLFRRVSAVPRIKQWDTVTRRVALVVLFLTVLVVAPVPYIFFAGTTKPFLVVPWIFLFLGSLGFAPFVFREARLYHKRHAERETYAGKQLLHIPNSCSFTTGSLNASSRIAFEDEEEIASGSDEEEPSSPQSTIYSDTHSSVMGESQLTPEQTALASSLLILQLLPDNLLQQLMQMWEEFDIAAGEVLIKEGETISNFIVVKSGQFNVVAGHGQHHLRSMGPMGTATSFLTLVEWLARTAWPAWPRRTPDDYEGSPPACESPVTLIASTDATLLKIPIADFAAFFSSRADVLSEAIRLVMFTLQRTAFMTLYDHLGLPLHALTQMTMFNSPSNAAERSPSIPPLDINLKTTPTSSPAGKACEPPSTCSPSKPVCKPIRDMPKEDQAKRVAASLKLGSSEEIAYIANAMNVISLRSGESITITGQLRDKQDCPDGDTILVNKFVALLQGRCHVFEPQRKTMLTQDKRPIMYEVVAVDHVSVVNPLSALTGEQINIQITAVEDATFAYFNLQELSPLLAKRPKVVLFLSLLAINYLSPVVRQMEFALQWVLVGPGEVLHDQGDSIQDTGMYVILHGRVRSECRTSDQETGLIVAELGVGATIGEAEMLSESNDALVSGWNSTVTAVRHTELCRVPLGTFRMLVSHFPAVMTHFCHALVHRLRFSKNSTLPARVAYPDWDVDIEGLQINHHIGVERYNTVALIPASSNVPLHNVAKLLEVVLAKDGSTMLLTSGIVKTHVGMERGKVTGIQLSSWLSVQEESHDFVIYEADTRNSAWTRRCIQQADILLVVGLVREGPGTGSVEVTLSAELDGCNARKEFVLLYTERDKAQDTCMFKPAPTRKWMVPRFWTNGHHHLRLPDSLAAIASRTDAMTVADKKELWMGDFGRLARRLSGNRVGVTLSGGGAKGGAHIGALRKMESIGMPVDIIGGTSMGAFIAALYATSQDLDTVTDVLVKYCDKFAGGTWEKVKDVTIPFTSLTSGDAFNRLIAELIGDICIEDFWIPYCCVTTNISRDKPMVHQQGTAWRYIRASMTLATFLPPICDGNNLLIDGGYANNLPADVVKSLGAKTVVGVDVGRADGIPYTNYGDNLSGWWLLWKKLPLPEWLKGQPVLVPGMSEINYRLAYLSCEMQLRRVKQTLLDYYICPRVQHLGMLEFSKCIQASKDGWAAAELVLPQKWEDHESEWWKATVHIPTSKSRGIYASVDMFGSMDMFPDMA